MATSFPDFLNQKAPENYVAGVGRGATSFTTRSDLGPTHGGPTDEQMKAAIAKRAQQLQSKAEGGDDKEGGGGGGEDKEGEGRYQDPDNEVGLFAGGIYEQDDEEADLIWQEVDERMAKRRQKQREAREKMEEEAYERANPKIEAQFADLKRALGTVSTEEWQNLPEVKDMTGKTKRARQAQRQRFYAVPDSVLAAARDAGELGTTVAESGTATTAGGGEGGSKTESGTMTNFAQIGAARDKVLQAHLDQASQTAVAAAVSGTSTVLGTASTVDPKGYITSLNRLETAERVSVSDVDFARKLLRSAVESNPTSGPGWIAAARVEELAGKVVAARQVIARGCAQCPRSEDVWLENIRLNEGRNAKVIAAEAIKANRRSVRLWVEAMGLESDVLSKKRVVRRALDHVPESEVLWKEAVNLEEDAGDARLLLAKATELIPASVDLWLALARLETPRNAKAVLNRARKAVPTSHEIWIAAARLQEQLGEAGPGKGKGSVMRSAVQALVREGAMPKREEWLAEAERCEAEGAAATSAAIVHETVGWGLDEDDDRRATWLEDARESTNRGRYATARAIYDHALGVFGSSRTVWLAAAELERAHGSRTTLFGVLERAVAAVPHSEVLWMMLAKERLAAGELDEARRVLGRAFRQNPDNEDIWLAAVKLEADNGHVDRAAELLATARQNAPTDRVWIRSVAFERQRGDSAAALALVQEALQLFPGAAKLWMQKGQIYGDDLGRVAEARAALAAGVKAVPGSVPLWLLYARLEERAGAVVKARSVLDRARQAVPGAAALWCEAVRVERRAGQLPQARALMATALKQLPRSGLLWAERIWTLEPRTQRKPLSLEAVKHVDNDPVLFVAVARVFWGERRLERAQNWFEKALVLDPDNGDAWAWYYRFLRQHGTPEKLAEVAGKCVQNDPRHGEHWQSVAKDPRNARKSVEEVLQLVAAGLQ